ncbi:MAG: PhnA domain-containing protein [Siphonobacter sp.]
MIENSQPVCVLCSSSQSVSPYTVLPTNSFPNEVTLCQTCLKQVEHQAELNPDYWQFLSETMWSDVPVIQVLSWRMLQRLKTESWAAELLDIFYLDGELLEWAKAVPEDEAPAPVSVHLDSLGNVLSNGDTVVLTKSLDVKGSNIQARIGTVVKNIRLVEQNTDQIEGKIEGQMIVILTKYLKKQHH